jgi:hypothetical protein
VLKLKLPKLPYTDFNPGIRKPDWCTAFLVWLGFPRPAFVRNIPEATRFYWFKCSNCGRISVDYPHGHNLRLYCHYCYPDKNGLSIKEGD